MDLAGQLRLIFAAGVIAIGAAALGLTVLAQWLSDRRPDDAEAGTRSTPPLDSHADRDRYQLEQQLEARHARWRLVL